MNINWNDVLATVITVVIIPAILLLIKPLVTEVTVYVIAKAKESWARTSQANKQTLEDVVVDARKAFVMLNANGQITDAVNKERDYVIQYAQNWFNAHNMKNIDASMVINEFAKQVQLGVEAGLKSNANG